MAITHTEQGRAKEKKILLLNWLEKGKFEDALELLGGVLKPKRLLAPAFNAVIAENAPREQ